MAAPAVPITPRMLCVCPLPCVRPLPCVHPLPCVRPLPSWPLRCVHTLGCSCRADRPQLPAGTKAAEEEMGDPHSCPPQCCPHPVFQHGCAGGARTAPNMPKPPYCCLSHPCTPPLPPSPAPRLSPDPAPSPTPGSPSPPCAPLLLSPGPRVLGGPQNNQAPATGRWASGDLGAAGSHCSPIPVPALRRAGEDGYMLLGQGVYGV